MKQYQILYALILLCIIFLIIYVNKKYNLEGYTYTYNDNLSFNSKSTPTPIANYTDPNNPVQESTCKLQCDLWPECTGFTTSNIVPNSKIPGNCKLYKHSKNDTEHLVGTKLYLKQP